MKVQLMKNLRIFEHDDTDFLIQGDQIKELPDKHLRSYSIKHYLFTGKLQVVEGDVLLHIKNSLVYINTEALYCKEPSGKYFSKQFPEDAITWLTEEEIPKDIFNKINEKTEEVEDNEKTEAVEDNEKTEEVNFEVMLKEDLIQYAKENNIELENNMKVGEIRKLLKK